MEAHRRETGLLRYAKETVRFLYTGLQAMGLPYMPYHERPAQPPVPAGPTTERPRVAV